MNGCFLAGPSRLSLSRRTYSASAPSFSSRKRKARAGNDPIRYEDALSEPITPEQQRSLDKISAERNPMLSRLFRLANEQPKIEPQPDRDVPPHELAEQNIFPLGYNRRIEALHEFSAGPVLEELDPPTEQKSVSTLSHGLNRVLFNPGVHWVQDPRSRVYNFSPWVKHIPRITDFAFERMTGFIPSSQDNDLVTLAKQEGRRFCGSTSSLTGMLSHIYFLISQDKEVDISNLSEVYRNSKREFTPGQRMPVTVQMNWHDGVYAIDSAGNDEVERQKNVLLWMGHLLEKFFTVPKRDFQDTYLRSLSPDWQPSPEEAGLREAYRYSMSEHYVMRSQLDGHNPALPGTGVFDIKTRASLPIRMDILNFAEGSGYLIRNQLGLKESFEKEYYDLVRSAFLKYSLQARIGNMDGVFVAYHNTGQVFGFQYIPLSEMEERLYGPGKNIGERVFNKSVGLLEILSKEIARCYPEESVRCTFETRAYSNRLEVYIEPVDPGKVPGRGPKPIKMVEVQASNFLGNNRTRGSRAVESDLPWTIHYIITHSLSTHEEIRKKLAECEQRKYRAFLLPTGVTHDEIGDFWDSLNFTGASRTTGGVNADNFQFPDQETLSLRMLARMGREETKRWAEIEREKPKIVLGEGNEIMEDATVYDDYGYAEGFAPYERTQKPLVREVESEKVVKKEIETATEAEGQEVDIGEDKEGDGTNDISPQRLEPSSTASLYPNEPKDSN